MYRNMTDLCNAALDCEYDSPELPLLQRLFKVYHHAQNNPPEGIIGVGAITYAEQMLIKAQQ